MTDRVSVLLVDDHSLVRRGLRRLLEDDPGILVVGEAGTGDAAIRLTAELKPQIIVMDLAMPGMSGLTATQRILEQWPAVAVVMLSMHDERHVVKRAIQLGVRSFVSKDAGDLNLADIVRRTATGESIVDPDVSLPPNKRPAHRLSPRQLEVLQLICQGLPNAAIAARLGLSVNTVGVHRASIMKALGVHRSGELVAYAIRQGLVDPH